MIIETAFEQGTPEWHEARIGNPGASGLDRIVTSSGKTSTQRKQYMYQLAGEKLTGSKAATYQTDAMKRGLELEPEARELFEFVQEKQVQQCAMIYPDESKRYHVSPDGIMLEEKAGLEIKCPSLPVAVEYLDKGTLPTKYRVQVQGSLMVTGWDLWWFISYFPGLEPLILPVERDEKLIDILRDEIEKFVDEMSELVERLR